MTDKYSILVGHLRSLETMNPLIFDVNNSLDGAVSKSSFIRLIGTVFASRYALPPSYIIPIKQRFHCICHQTCGKTTRNSMDVIMFGPVFYKINAYTIIPLKTFQAIF